MTHMDMYTKTQQLFFSERIALDMKTPAALYCGIKFPDRTSFVHN